MSMPSRNTSSPKITLRGTIEMPRSSANFWGRSAVLSVTIRTATWPSLGAVYQPPPLPGSLQGDDVVVVRLPAVDHLDVVAGECVPQTARKRLRLFLPGVRAVVERDQAGALRLDPLERAQHALLGGLRGQPQLVVHDGDGLGLAHLHAAYARGADGPAHLDRSHALPRLLHRSDVGLQVFVLVQGQERGYPLGHGARLHHTQS